MKRESLPVIHVVLLLGLMIVLLTNLYFSSSVNWAIFENERAQKEAARPAEISIVHIAEACYTCPTLSSELLALKKRNVDVKEEETLTREEAADLIAKYGIKKLPAYIITGDIEKIPSSTMRKEDGALVREVDGSRFIDALSGDDRGKVEAIILTDPSCEQCADLASLVTSLQEAEMAVGSPTILARADAAEMIQKYNIDFLPVLVLKGDVQVYEDLLAPLTQIGTFEEDGTYVLRQVTPPFVNLSTDKVVGKVSVTYLVDSTCSECYDPTLHRQILSRLGMTYTTEKTIDVGSESGKSFVAKYEITSVPTLILSDDASVYALFDEIWAQVGTKEDDGSYVFRKNEVLVGQTYKDLTTNEIHRPADEKETSETATSTA